ncbi:DUF5675 family protein [Ideonella sp. DXS29W]|uniref:DUF5675 family protein n=1 Tax=Ideonella lacteola TaxID=2984193 RepID=A0ABU9BWP5_9BURK
MQILVDRFLSDSDTTISHVTVDGQFVCFGLEDEYRADKVAHETRIPAGEYHVGVRTAGKHHTQYKAQFPDIHRGMLHVQDVPGFEFILIHCGNTQADTSGCLLVGTGAVTDPGNMSISSSRIAYRKFYPMVIGAALEGSLSIRYVDNDRLP